jgi:hypothetical protein
LERAYFILSNFNNLNNRPILKQHSLITATFQDDIKFKEIHHDLVNALIYIFQNDLLIDCKQINLFNFNLLQERSIKVSLKHLETYANTKRRNGEFIYQALKDIRDHSQTIKNFIDIDGTKYAKSTLALLDDVNMLQEEGLKTYFMLKYSYKFTVLCIKEYSVKYGNFASLNIAQTNFMSSKYSKRLYEFLKSRTRRIKAFTVKHSDLIIILNMPKNSEFSKVVRQINRIEKEVNEFIKFNYEVDKKTKKIVFSMVKD